MILQFYENKQSETVNNVRKQPDSLLYKCNGAFTSNANGGALRARRGAFDGSSVPLFELFGVLRVSSASDK